MFTVFLQNVNEPPNCANEAFIRIVPEKSVAGTVLNPPLQCFDPDFGSLQYSIVSGNDLGYFVIDATSGLFSAAVKLPIAGFDTINITLVLNVTDFANVILFNATISIQDIPMPPFFDSSEVCVVIMSFLVNLCH